MSRSSACHGASTEAITLPVLFLTVALIGGFRLAADGSGMRFIPPPLVSLLLATLLLGVMARARLLVTQRLLSSLRDPLENISGAVVLGALFVASAQLFNCLAPEAGLLHLLFNLFFAALLWNTLAAEPDAPRLLRSLVVVFGSAFAIKYIILASLYDPAGGMLKRVLTILLEGVTLGALDYQPHAAVTGYVAFAAIGLFMLGAFLLSQGGRTSSDRFAESVDTDESGITTRQVHGSDDRQSAVRRLPGSQA